MGWPTRIGAAPGESVNGVGYGDGVIDSERSGLSSFFYTHGDPTFWGIPQQDYHFYRYQRGLWVDGVPMCWGGFGHPFWPTSIDSIPAKFLFPHDSDPLGWATGGISMPTWSMELEGTSPFDWATLTSTSAFSLPAGGEQQMEIAWVHGRSNSTANASRLQMLTNSDTLRQLYTDSLIQGYVRFPCVPIQQMATGGALAYPNPASQMVTLSISGVNPTDVVSWSLYDLMGTLQQQGTQVGNGNEQIPVTNLKPGIYLLATKGPGLNKTLKVAVHPSNNPGPLVANK